MAMGSGIFNSELNVAESINLFFLTVYDPGFPESKPFEAS
jgi:hypothetical protein